MLSEFEQKMLSRTGVNDDKKTQQLVNYLTTQFSRKVYISNEEYKNTLLGKWLDKNNKPQRNYLPDRGFYEIRDDKDGSLYAIVLSYVDETSNKYLVLSYSGAINLYDPENDSLKSLEDLETVGDENAMELEDIFKILDKQDILTPANVGDGTLDTIIGFDSQGKLKKAVPAGNVVDDALSDSSENPVQNKVITKKINDIENGSQPVGKADFAQNLIPVSQESGSIQETPFILQGTGTANGADVVDTGKTGQHLEKQANTVAVNQLCKTLSTDNYRFSNAIGTITSGVATFTATAQYGNMVCDYNFDVINEHYYLAICTLKLTTAVSDIRVQFRDNAATQTIIQVPSSTSKQTVFGIKQANGSIATGYVRVLDNRASNWDAIQVSELYFIDLTQWFNGDIPQDLLDNPENFFRYYQGSLAYNLGQLVASNGRYLTTSGRNICDEQWESGYINSSGSLIADGSSLRSKNYNNCIPNMPIYSYGVVSGESICWYDKDKNFIQRDTFTNTTIATPPSNALFFKLSLYGYGSTYNNDITVSLYYTTGNGYDQYYPYVLPKVYDTGSEELLSARSAKDIKVPDGTITRRVDTETLDADKAVGATITISGIKEDTTNVVSKYGALSEWGTISGTTITLTKALSNGDKIYFEKASATTEQGTPFSENIDIDDYGTMAWYSAYTDENTNTPVAIPQGCKIFYPAWCAGFIDSLGQREDIDWDAENIVSQAQLGVVSGRVPALSDSAEDGTYTLKATKSGDTIAYSWTVDE